MTVVREDLTITRADLDRLRNDITLQIHRLEAKLDEKPSMAALYQAVVVMMFGLSMAITATVIVLNNIGLLKH